MGGNALKSVPTRRLPAAQYHALAQEVATALSGRFGARAEPIPAYRSKEDFGDLDVLVEQEKVLGPEGQRDLLEQFALEHGHAREIVCNGPVMSYDHRASPAQEVGFQVDLILSPAKEMDASLVYYSYNDLGNLMGRIAHKMGFSYGHRGLLLPVRSGTKQAAVLEVCALPSRCMEFMGYDPARFAQGFGDRQEIYEYACSTPYFHPDIFLLENRNHTSRTRDRKRTTYMGFLDYLKGLPPDWERFDFPEDKAAWIPLAYVFFPDLAARHKQVLDEVAMKERLREHFNGQLVAAWTGLSGPELGSFLSRTKAQLGGVQGLAALLDEHGPQALRAKVQALHGLRGSRAPRPS